MNEQTLDNLHQVRRHYQRCLEVERPGIEDHAISAEGMKYILDTLEDIRLDRTDERVVVLEMGTGFSTLVLRAWSSGSPTSRNVVSVDHDALWADMMIRILSESDLPTYPIMDIEWLRQDTKQSYDAILIDHGPSLVARIASSRWVSELLKPGGVLLYDDWRARFALRIRGSLGPLGFRFVEDDRSFALGKHIGLGRRVASPAQYIPPLEPLCSPRRSERQKAKIRRQKRRARRGRR